MEQSPWWWLHSGTIWTVPEYKPFRKPPQLVRGWPPASLLPATLCFRPGCLTWSMALVLIYWVSDCLCLMIAICSCPSDTLLISCLPLKLMCLVRFPKWRSPNSASQWGHLLFPSPCGLSRNWILLPKIRADSCWPPGEPHNLPGFLFSFILA